MGINHRIILLNDAKFSRNSPIGPLTDKQCKVITTVFKLGHHDIPRKIGSTELGKKLGIGNPAFVMQRKAERRLRTELLSES